jgi:uncharacterized protein
VLTTDLVQIRRLGTEKAAENVYFRRYLSAHHRRIEELQRVAAAVEPEIDCAACANCCRNSVVAITAAEIAGIAAFLGIDPAEAEHRYTEPDPEDSALRVLRNSTDGCVFLEGNLCLIYEHRPKPCREFPHLAPGTHSLGARISSICRWAALCPIVYNAIEIYKHQVGFHLEHSSRESGSSGCGR